MPEGEPDGATQEDSILGTEPPTTDSHVMESVQEDIDPPPVESNVDAMQEDLLNEIYENTVHESGVKPGEGGAVEPLAPREAEKCQDGGESGGSKPSQKVELTEEQRAHMEANRLKALERAAAARARGSQWQPTQTAT